MTHDTAQTREALVEAMARVVADGFYFGMPQVDPDAVPDGLASDIANAALLALEAAGVRLVPEETYERLEELLAEIGDTAHHASTGPAVPDTYWEIRRLAYSGVDLSASPYAKDKP